MLTRSQTWRLVSSIVMVIALSAALRAQSAAAGPAAEGKERDFLENIKFRNLGPAVGGGRVAAVVGVPGHPNIYYAGAAVQKAGGQ